MPSVALFTAVVVAILFLASTNVILRPRLRERVGSVSVFVYYSIGPLVGVAAASLVPGSLSHYAGEALASGVCVGLALIVVSLLPPVVKLRLSVSAAIKDVAIDAFESADAYR